MQTFFTISSKTFLESLTQFENVKSSNNNCSKTMIERYIGPVLFRHHRGTLAESMKTVVVVNSVEDLKKEILKEDELFNALCETIKIEFYGYDERIGWNTHIVSIVDQNGKAHPVGWTSGDLT